MVILVLLIQILFSLVLSINFNFVSIPLYIGESVALFFPPEMCCDYLWLALQEYFKNVSFCHNRIKYFLISITEVHHILLFIIFFNYDIFYVVF